MSEITFKLCPFCGIEVNLPYPQADRIIHPASFARKDKPSCPLSNQLITIERWQSNRPYEQARIEDEVTIQLLRLELSQAKADTDRLEAALKNEGNVRYQIWNGDEWVTTMSRTGIDAAREKEKK